ncbi:hypothetical protein, partial [Micromonospora chalcea]|uniref:hypothetical protein n=1 Tax=Micromonospora chalcea TaxID=1874 RepID=UPI00332587C5
ELAAAYHMHSLHAGADGEFGEELRYSQRADGAHAGAVVPRLRSAVPDPRAEADPAGRTPVRAVPAAGPTTWRNR